MFAFLWGLLNLFFQTACDGLALMLNRNERIARAFSSRGDEPTHFGRNYPKPFPDRTSPQTRADCHRPLVRHLTHGNGDVECDNVEGWPFWNRIQGMTRSLMFEFHGGADVQFVTNSKRRSDGDWFLRSCIECLCVFCVRQFSLGTSRSKNPGIGTGKIEIAKTANTFNGTLSLT